MVHDPHVEESFGAKYEKDLERAVKGVDIIVIVTDHREFKNLNLKTLRKLMRSPIIVDGRRVINPKEAREAGFTYYGIGYGKV